MVAVLGDVTPANAEFSGIILQRMLPLIDEVLPIIRFVPSLWLKQQLLT
jgi:hypothetical protein